MDASAAQTTKELLAQGKSREEIKAQLLAQGVAGNSVDDMLDIFIPTQAPGISSVNPPASKANISAATTASVNGYDKEYMAIKHAGRNARIFAVLFLGVAVGSALFGRGIPNPANDFPHFILLCVIVAGGLIFVAGAKILLNATTKPIKTLSITVLVLFAVVVALVFTGLGVFGLLFLLSLEKARQALNRIRHSAPMP